MFPITAQNVRGFGLVQLNEALRLNDDLTVQPYNLYNFDICRNKGLNKSDIHEYKFRTNANSKRSLKVTLTWTDPPGSPFSRTQLVNNLDLILLNETNDIISCGNDYINGKDQIDDTNNIEQIIIDTSELITERIFTVQIKGSRIPIGPQSYALIVTIDGIAIDGRSTIKSTSCNYPNYADGKHHGTNYDNDDDDSSSSNVFYPYIIGACIALVIIFIIIYFIYRRQQKRKQQYEQNMAQFVSHGSLQNSNNLDQQLLP
jgi:hypothetical protein